VQNFALGRSSDPHDEQDFPLDDLGINAGSGDGKFPA